MNRPPYHTRKGLHARVLVGLRIGLGLFTNNTLFNPSPHPTCVDLANELEISEHEVFIRAYRWYYGRSPISIRKEFKRYILSGCADVPHYVRQFTRHWTRGELHA